MKNKNPVLRKWYIEKSRSGNLHAHGVVTGHWGFSDNTLIHTSAVTDLKTDTDNDEAVITTKNTVYYCKLSSCRFEKQDNFPDIIENYGLIKERYYVPEKSPDIEPGRILLILSDHDEHYFHSLILKNEKGEPEEYRNNAHIGMFQDSYLIFTLESHTDIRYFIGDRSIEFYALRTNGMPLYIANTGESDITVNSGDTKINLKAGERICFTELMAKDKSTED